MTDEAHLRQAAHVALSLDTTSAFVSAHARLLDRRRYDLLLGPGDRDATETALAAYRNPDGGYGWGLEPDLRAVESQPAGALHAFEVFAEIGPTSKSAALGLCDWLERATLEDGGLPFALPIADRTGCAPFWIEADHSTSSLHITAAVTAEAWKVAAVVPDMIDHPWLERATAYCLGAIVATAEPGHALELRYSLRFLDAVHDRYEVAARELERMSRHIPSSGMLHVAGGLEDEMMRPLDFAPDPGRPLRDLFRPELIADELDRLEGLRSADGGWPLGWRAYSPAAALEWRGYVTVDAIRVLKANGRLDTLR